MSANREPIEAAAIATSSTSAAAEPSPLTFKAFLESTAPESIQEVRDLFSYEAYFNGATRSADYGYKLAVPAIQLYCTNNACKGNLLFTCISTRPTKPDNDDVHHVFLTYCCKNCENTQKMFALAYRRNKSDAQAGHVVKLGELPGFGPRVPSRLISLIGPDSDLFLRGSRAEVHGLGIGAFAYYRRVVETQKGRLIEEVGKVARKLGASADVIDRFDRAAQETQFARAIELLKDAIPDALKIEGHNPLTLLHDALSDGLQAETDAECLRIAADIRIVLAALAVRLSDLLKEQASVKNAVSRLLTRHLRQQAVADPESGNGTASA
ncbi:MAG TPA: hypothetical protein VKB50_09795 [Vicinamibacterales bacterium]|nr:hypothetical protein [Vicinamibacterales bacterium]